MVPSAFIGTRRGPMQPMCSQTEAEPGPPLNENVSGRELRFSTPSRVYAMKKMRASVSPSRFLIGIMPVVAVYLSSFPPTVIE